MSETDNNRPDAGKKVTAQEAFNLLQKRLSKLQREMDSINQILTKTGISPEDDRVELLKRIAALEEKVSQKSSEDRLSILVFSGEFDRIMSAFIIATAAAASNMQVDMFFTFWSLNALKKKGGAKYKKTFLQKMFGIILPRGSHKLPLSNLNLGGIGPTILRYMIEKGGVMSLEELIEAALEMGVTIKTCEMTRNLLGIGAEELIHPFEEAGAATYIDNAARASVTLFI